MLLCRLEDVFRNRNLRRRGTRRIDDTEEGDEEGAILSKKLKMKEGKNLKELVWILVFSYAVREQLCQI